MLEVNNVCVSFRSERQEKIFGTARNQVLFDVSLKVSQGTCLGILGESGSGKSTLGRVICGLLKPDTGEVKIQDVSVYASRNGRKNLQKRLSVVFQDYTTSANPRFRVKEIIAEGLAARERNQKIRLNRLEEINRLLELVGLNSSYANRYPHELSGGQLQRVCIARAVACQPEIILFDEAISSLDAHTQIQIMDLLHDLKEKLGLTYIFITHCSRSKFLTKLLKTFDKTFREIFPVFISTKRREKPSAFFDNNFVNNAYFSEAASSSSSHLASSSSKAPISSRMTCLCLWSS